MAMDDDKLVSDVTHMRNLTLSPLSLQVAASTAADRRCSGVSNSSPVQLRRLQEAKLNGEEIFLGGHSSLGARTLEATVLDDGDEDGNGINNIVALEYADEQEHSSATAAAQQPQV